MNGKCVSRVPAELLQPRRVPRSIDHGKRDRPAGPWQKWALHWTAGLLVTALLTGVALPSQTDAVDRVKNAISAYNAAMETKPRDQRLRQFAIAEQLFRQLVDGDTKHAANPQRGPVRQSGQCGVASRTSRPGNRGLPPRIRLKSAQRTPHVRTSNTPSPYFRNGCNQK